MKKVIISAFALLLSVSVFAQKPKTHRTSSESTSVSVSNSDHSYTALATFSTPKLEQFKKLLIQRLGKPTEINGSTYEWNVKNSYSVSLRAGRLMIDLDKDKTAADVIKKFERLGNEIQPLLEEK